MRTYKSTTVDECNPQNNQEDFRYCCTGIYFGPAKRYNYGNCPPTEYSKFFKNKCGDAYSWPQDDNNNTFACIAKGYEMTFCP